MAPNSGLHPPQPPPNRRGRHQITSERNQKATSVTVRTVVAAMDRVVNPPSSSILSWRRFIVTLPPVFTLVLIALAPPIRPNRKPQTGRPFSRTALISHRPSFGSIAKMVRMPRRMRGGAESLLVVRGRNLARNNYGRNCKQARATREQTGRPKPAASQPARYIVITAQRKRSPKGFFRISRIRPYNNAITDNNPRWEILKLLWLPGTKRWSPHQT